MAERLPPVHPAITADTAMRLTRYFGASAAVWLRLQARYDLEVAEVEYGERVKREVRVLDRGRVAAVTV